MSKSIEEIEIWMQRKVAYILGVYPDEIDIEGGFLDLGLDSVTGLELTTELEDWVGSPIAPTFLGEHDSIRAVARALGRA